MKAFNYTVIDMRRGKVKIILMAMFGVLGFMFAQNSLFFGIAYVFFAAIILSASSFMLEEKAETGFINLLPGSNKDRVAGRFMTGILYDIIATVTGIIIVTIFYLKEQINMKYVPEIMIGFTGVALVYMAIQNILFFAIGKHNSRQLMSFIIIIPGIIFYVTAMFIGEIFETKILERHMAEFIDWIQKNSIVAAGSVLALGILFTIAGIYIVEKIIAGKDYA